PTETSLEEVLKYVKSATQGPNDAGIQIYLDPVGLSEADKTPSSPVTIDLEGIPLKTTLRLILKQLGLTYTVKDGMITITSETSDDQPTEIRVYPVADLALIPMSLMMGGGGGMMGGGMGGGMMGGGMGGMMSIGLEPQDAPSQSAFTEKKSN
ncbi:MAG: STN domain-containing protein, partial [Planctomycetota bacterium]|nr:STN domain-containing protein [Planctomycetota bacterium]